MAPMSHPAAARVACDSLVALGSCTADDNILFAKNSDRPAFECQPLQLIEPAIHPTDAHVRCTYIEIPQAHETYRVLGSRPYWCWGFEHGLNQHGVAIGNHTVFTRDPLPGIGLIGMDLVRLGLERGESAHAALDVITTLLEHHGQGGSGYSDKEWPYHNSFLIADRAQAFILETSDRHWAWREVHDAASLSNHLSIGADWDELSSGAIAHALAQGWWSEADGRFDFAAAYRDREMAPAVISGGRHRRTCEFLSSDRGRLSAAGMRHVLRDHYGSPWPRPDGDPADEQYFSVCMHADPVGTTTASMIATLPADIAQPLIVWASLGSPCVGAFLPLFLDAPLPPALSAGGAEPSDDSAWWAMKQLLQYVEQSWESRLPPVRAAIDELEQRLTAQLPDVGSDRRSRGAFMQAAVAELMALARQLRA
ncbi:MAG TPA: hypothetical protein VEB21_19935 [Terriglobales bacterium]|nr:hypothetical protein [Terriglobales bacterium]